MMCVSFQLSEQVAYEVVEDSPNAADAGGAGTADGGSDEDRRKRPKLG